jgi:hypothetical protein
MQSQAAQPMTGKVCDQQGRTYVTEKNKDESIDPGQSFYWSFVAAHYDSHTNTCYVMYDRFVRGLGRVLEQMKIDDIEGNNIAEYSGLWTSNRNGRPIYSRELVVGKLIPVFIKNTTCACVRLMAHESRDPIR